jgi:predicted nucleic acid-binding protein
MWSRARRCGAGTSPRRPGVSARPSHDGLDALHLALALEADAATFVSFDMRLTKAAAAHQLFVAPEIER